MRARGLRQQIRARRHHADIFNRGIRCSAGIAADKVPDIAARARRFVAGDAKPDPAGHSPDRESDGFRQAFRRYAAMIIDNQRRLRWRGG